MNAIESDKTGNENIVGNQLVKFSFQYNQINIF